MHAVIFIYHQARHPPTSNTNHLGVKCFLPCSSNQYPSSIYDSQVWEATCRNLLNFMTFLFMYFNKEVAQLLSRLLQFLLGSYNTDIKMQMEESKG